MPFLLIFVVIPLLELMIFFSVGEHIGFFPALLCAFLTAIIGGSIVRFQGFQTLFSFRDSVSKGKLPKNEIFDGFFIVAAGALLITPGFLTDTIGFLLLIPVFRRFLRHIIEKNTRFSVKTSGFSTQTRSHSQDPDIIEGEYETVNDNDMDKLPK